MMWWVFLVSALAAPDEVAARMAVLERHYERLEAYAVAPAFEDEKGARIADLRRRLDGGAATGADVNTLYRAMDDVRMWLWDHGAERPERTPGSFRETPTTWTVTTPDLTLAVDRSTLAM